MRIQWKRQPVVCDMPGCRNLGELRIAMDDNPGDDIVLCGRCAQELGESLRAAKLRVGEREQRTETGAKAGPRGRAGEEKSAHA